MLFDLHFLFLFSEAFAGFSETVCVVIEENESCLPLKALMILKVMALTSKILQKM